MKNSIVENSEIIMMIICEAMLPKSLKVGDNFAQSVWWQYNFYNLVLSVLMAVLQSKEKQI